MLIHLARLSVITIALALVGGLGFLLARPAAPNVITVVVPATPAAAPVQSAVVQPVYVAPYWASYCGWQLCTR